MEEQRGHNFGRREEDERWLKVQKEIMDLVTSVRTTQQGVTKLDLQVGKLEDHVDDVDDHLRGVAGHDSMDTRVAVLERSSAESNALLRSLHKKIDAQNRVLDAIQIELGGKKIASALVAEAEGSKLERFKQWMQTIWGPLATLFMTGVIVWGFQYAITHWDEIKKRYKAPSKDPVAQMIQKAKRPRKTVYVPRVVPAPKPIRENPNAATGAIMPEVQKTDEGNAR